MIFDHHKFPHRHGDDSLPKAGTFRWMVLLSVAGVFGFSLWFWETVSSPTSHILRAENGAEWIRLDIPTELNGREIGEIAVGFRHTFRRSCYAAESVLTVRAMKNVTVFLDDMAIYSDPPGYSEWMKPRSVPLPSFTADTVHVLLLLVRAQDTHPAVLAHCEALELRTGASWESAVIGGKWRPAMLARTPHPPKLAYQFPPTYKALTQIAPWLALIFAIVATWTVVQDRRGWSAPPAASVRWYLLLLWAILAANNCFKFPANVGMDLPCHFEYIQHLAETGRIPLAPDGFQMFQSPLYYLVSAPLYSILRDLSPVEIQHWLRIIPLLCGLLQVELSYRAVRTVLPDRDDLQVAGTILGGFLPMNLYISQAIGNEPLAGLFASLAIVLVLQRMQSGQSCLLPRFAALLGSVLGLALLTKASALLLILGLGAFCLWWSLHPCRSDAHSALPRRVLAAALCFGGPILLIAGWYYVRNWVLLGRPFIGGWDTARGISWWQDNGYIALESLVDFGQALIRPIYAQTAGIWNGLYCTFWLDGSLSSVVAFAYRPPWNYDFILGSALLALIPSAAMIAGAIKNFRHPAVKLSVGCIVVYVGAIFAFHLSVMPGYCSIKATYLLGLLPCFAILAATGLGALPRNVWIRATAHGLFACWAVSAYLGYFVI